MQRPSICNVDDPDMSGSKHACPTGRVVTQHELGIILSQLKTDLIVATRSVRPPVCQTCFTSSFHFDDTEGSVEDAVKGCVDNVLKRWAPEFYMNSSTVDGKSGCAEQPVLGSSGFFDPSFESALLDPTGLFEPLLPAEGSAASRPISVEFSDTCSKLSLDVEGPNKSCRRHNRKTWETHKEALKQLYVVQSLPLPAVMKKMREEHGFTATVKQYRYQLSEIWKWRKYNSGSATKSGVGPDAIQVPDKESVEGYNSSSSVEELGI
ncbi:hypothetical protein GGR50DRAFT_425662 [Xylaria sp. CBS 124048]|nr:hypothetical protein GGR50DRAFT_425662 [Xylaria sp. CBS 124048]